MQSCHWLSQSSVPSQQLGCFPRSSPRNPPRMEHDLLSCKHIGSSIENGLTKSIKADIIPGIRGWGGGRRWRRPVAAEHKYPPFLLQFPPRTFITQSLPFLLVCHLCPRFCFCLSFRFLFMPVFISSFYLLILLSLLFLPLSAFFLFHALGSGQLQQWLYQTYLQGCL